MVYNVSPASANLTPRIVATRQIFQPCGPLVSSQYWSLLWRHGGRTCWCRSVRLFAPTDRRFLLAAWQTETLTIPFASIRHLRMDDFLRLLRDHYDITGVRVSADFRGGYQRHADAADVVSAAAGALGMSADITELRGNADGRWSSSRLRQALATGDCATVTSGLGRYHASCGTVVQGDQRGRTIGFPTANIIDFAGLPPQVGGLAPPG